MIKYINYQNIKKSYKLKLDILLNQLYPQFKKTIIKRNGTMVLVKHQFLFYRTGVKKHIFELLFDDIPRTMSWKLYNSFDFVSHYRNKIMNSLNSSNFLSEIEKVEDVIDVLHYIATNSGLLNVKDIHEAQADVKVIRITNVRPIESISSVRLEEEPKEALVSMKENLLYIFDGLLNTGTYRVRKATCFAMLFLSINLTKLDSFVKAIPLSIDYYQSAEYLTNHVMFNSS